MQNHLIDRPKQLSIKKKRSYITGSDRIFGSRWKTEFGGQNWMS